MFGEEPKDPKGQKTVHYLLSAALHAMLIGLFVFFAMRKEKPVEEIIPIELAVVINENLDGVEDEPPPEPAPPEPEPPEPRQPEPDPVPPPPEPEPLPSNVEAVEIKRVEEKNPEPPKEDPAKVAAERKKKAEERKRKEQERLERMRNRVKDVKNPKPLVTETTNGRTDRRPPNWRELLNQGYKPSNENKGIDAGENARCIALIRQAFHDRWQSPAWNSELREIYLSVRFGPGGKVLEYSISQSSGDPSADNTVLRAAAQVKRVGGLSPSFLEANKVVTVRFKVTPQ